MESDEIEVRNALLEADPDGIEWKEIADKPEVLSQRSSWFEVVTAELFVHFEGYQDLLRRLAPIVANQLGNGGAVNTLDLYVATQLRALGDVALICRAMIIDGLHNLARGHGVPSDQLIPQLVGQDWSTSSLSSSGKLELHARLYMIKAPHVSVELERKVTVMIPRSGFRLMTRALA